MRKYTKTYKKKYKMQETPCKRCLVTKTTDRYCKACNAYVVKDNRYAERLGI